MKMKEIKNIENYRNLNHVSITFHEDINFIIGENNIGKTNLLDLLYSFFMIHKFKPTDFYDVTLPISIEIELDDGQTLKGIQKNIDESIEYNVSSLDVFNFCYLEIPSGYKENECIQRIRKQLNKFIHSKESSHFIIKDNKKVFPLFLLIDEPEIHLHPYHQRSLIKKISNLLKDESIDYLGMGQIFIVTHSPNILLQDYRQFIRLAKKDNEIQAISGMNINLENTKLYKHMLHNFIYLKEAMFSNKIIFVEGDTENGAFPMIAKRLHIDLDEKGIGIVKLDGAESVLKCMSLYTKFGIPSLAILDRDKIERYNNKRNIFFTNGIDFEEDIYDSFELQDYLYCLKEIGGLEHYYNILKRESIMFDYKTFMENPVLSISKEKASEIMIKQKEEQLHYLREKKNAVKGYTLCLYVTHIPDSYKTVIEQAI